MIWLCAFLQGHVDASFELVLLSATMAYLMTGQERNELSRVMALYISATIVCGVVGRVVSGQLAS